MSNQYYFFGTRTTFIQAAPKIFCRVNGAKDIFTCFAWSRNKNFNENGRRIPRQGETVTYKKACSSDL